MTGFVGAMEAVVWDRICGTMEAVVLGQALWGPWRRWFGTDFVGTMEAVVLVQTMWGPR